MQNFKETSVNVIQALTIVLAKNGSLSADEAMALTYLESTQDSGSAAVIGRSPIMLDKKRDLFLSNRIAV